MLEDNTASLVIELRRMMGLSEFREKYGSGSGELNNDGRTAEQLKDLATTIAQYVAYGITPEMLKEYLKSGSSVQDLTEKEKILEAKQKADAVKLAQEEQKRLDAKIKAENEQITRITDFNNAISGLAVGGESKLAQFSTAIGSATNKLAQFTLRFNGSPHGLEP